MVFSGGDEVLEEDMQDDEFLAAVKAPVDVETAMVVMEEIVEEIAQRRYVRRRCERCGREHLLRRRGAELTQGPRFPESWLSPCP